MTTTPPTAPGLPLSERILKLRGMVSTVCTTGQVQIDTAWAIRALNDWNVKHGLVLVEYVPAEAKLVESGRDALCEHALKNAYDYLLMIDGDAAPFAEHALARMLQLTFEIEPSIDVLGAYCQVKGAPYLPTIDTGTGTWQAEPAYQGTLPVIRTGGHFLLIKTPILRAFGPPWFRSRQAWTATKTLQEFDNLARCNLNGGNPLTGTAEWAELVAKAAKAGAPQPPTSVGEDSGFCDSVRAAGGNIAVDTDLIVGHVAKQVILPKLLVDAVNSIEGSRFERVGVRGYL